MGQNFRKEFYMLELKKKIDLDLKNFFKKLFLFGPKQIMNSDFQSPKDVCFGYVKTNRMNIFQDRMDAIDTMVTWKNNDKTNKN